MSVLDRKVWRDVVALRGQVLTISLLVGAGVAVLVMSTSAFLSLRSAMEAHYAETHFGEIFTRVVRAPLPVLEGVAEIPGVAALEARITGEARVDWPGAEVPVAARVLSLPRHGGQPALNRLILSAGAWPDLERRDEALLHSAFAEAWGVRPGDSVTVILNGRRERFRVVGIAHSAEFVFTSRPGNPLPDDRGYLVLWAQQEALARAFDMQGAFNEIVLALAPGATAPRVIAELDRLLQPWGGLGAYARRDQPSHRLLEDELAEQRTLSVIVPLVFLGIAAFLLNVALGRMVEAQREQVAALRALGYPAGPIAAHYAKFVAVICLLGAAIGVALGAWMGAGLLERYRPFFRFPAMPYVLPPWLPVLASFVAFLGGLSGVLLTLWRMLRQPAAEGLRPLAPAALGGLTLRRFGSRLGPRPKMVLRGFVGRPLRSALTVLGLSLAMPMVVLGLFWSEALDTLIDVQFDRIERGDAIVALTDPRHARAVREMARLPGVLAAEGQRVVPVRLRAGPRSHLLGLTGMPEGAELRVPRDAGLRPIPVPREGVAISRRLAEKLGLRAGETLQAEVLEGERPTLELPVAALVDDMLGLSALMEIGALNRALREGDLVSHVALQVDPMMATELWRALAAKPRVTATNVRSVGVRVFREAVGGMVRTSATVLTGFGVIIAAGVVYNSARVTLQERGWEMASLRVLGFSRAEAGRILLAELVLRGVPALPLGLILSQVLVSLLVGLRENESFDLPSRVGASTLIIAGLVVVGTAALSAMAVWRRMGRLDMVAALKARE